MHIAPFFLSLPSPFLYSLKIKITQHVYDTPIPSKLAQQTTMPARALFFIFILANALRCSEPTVVLDANMSTAPMLPVMEAGRMMMMNDSRRKLGSFQICALCTCCGGAKGVCLPSPCCYAINCNIPNRPFGFCSFTPKTCNCFGCHL